MGFNTTVVILNDSLDMIANDPYFGSRLVDAALVTDAIDDTLSNDLGNVAWPLDATAREADEH